MRFRSARLAVLLVLDARLTEFHPQDIDPISLVDETIHSCPGAEESAHPNARIAQRMTEAGHRESTARKRSLCISGRGCENKHESNT